MRELTVFRDPGPTLTTGGTAVPAPADDLIKRIAMDIGKEVVAHIEHAYPQMFAAVAETAKLSIRNATYNAIMAAGEAFGQGLSEQRLKQHAEHRRTMRRMRKSSAVDS